MTILGQKTPLLCTVLHTKTPKIPPIVSYWKFNMHLLSAINRKQGKKSIPAILNYRLGNSTKIVSFDFSILGVSGT
jgi:hypothetical protein